MRGTAGFQGRARLYSCFAFGVVALLSAPSARAQVWVAREGGLGVDEFKFLLSAGLNYGIVNGSELEKVDPSIGLNVNVAYRLFSAVSLCASVGRNTSSVDAQVIQLLDQQMREDGRSASTKADVTMTRLGAGARLDAFREQNWRYRPYIQAEVLLSKFELAIDSVDGGPPRSEIDGFSDTQIGALGRAGLDVRVTERFGLDLSVSHEVLEFPAGTSGISTGQAGVSVRL